MTEHEWLAATDPGHLLRFVGNRAGERKLQLFACACSRRLWHLLPDGRYRAAVEFAERFADGRATRADLDAAQREASDAFCDLNRSDAPGRYSRHTYAADLACATSAGPSSPAAVVWAQAILGALHRWTDDRTGWRIAEHAAQCDLLRDIIGPPFRVVRMDPAWLAFEDGLCVRLAKAMYAANEFAELPRLADALERAGCTDREVLAHCRNKRDHVRGCWVVDALLGRDAGDLRALATERDWHACTIPEPLLEHLRGKGTDRQWQLFGVACCRRGWHLLADRRSRAAVEVMERFADARATPADVEQAQVAAAAAERDAARAEYHAEGAAGFSPMPEYCAAMATTRAARAALCLFSRTNLEPVPRQDPAARQLFDWRLRFSCNDLLLQAIERSLQWDTRDTVPGETAGIAWRAETAWQATAIRDIFGLHFGPPGAEQRWLPYTDHDEVWALIPQPRTVSLTPTVLAWRDTAVPRLARTIYDDRAFERMPFLGDLLEDAGCDDGAILGHCRNGLEHTRGCWVLDLVLGQT